MPKVASAKRASTVAAARAASARVGAVGGGYPEVIIPVYREEEGGGRDEEVLRSQDLGIDHDDADYNPEVEGADEDDDGDIFQPAPLPEEAPGQSRTEAEDAITEEANQQWLNHHKDGAQQSISSLPSTTLQGSQDVSKFIASLSQNNDAITQICNVIRDEIRAKSSDHAFTDESFVQEMVEKAFKGLVSGGATKPSLTERQADAERMSWDSQPPGQTLANLIHDETQSQIDPALQSSMDYTQAAQDTQQSQDQSRTASPARQRDRSAAKNSPKGDGRPRKQADESKKFSEGQYQGRYKSQVMARNYPGGRVNWTPDMENILVYAMYTLKCSWRKIDEQYGEFLMRNQVGLKDKARNMKMWYLRRNQEPHWVFGPVTCAKFVKAKSDIVSDERPSFQEALDRIDSMDKTKPDPDWITIRARPPYPQR